MKLDPQRLVFGLFLLVLIVVGEIILSHFSLPVWPAFMIMIFFFMEHMDIKKAPHMLVGGLFGIACILLIKWFVTALGPVIGVELSKLLFICIFVYAIIAFGEMIPIVLNNYAFMFFTVSAAVAILLATMKEPKPFPLVEVMGVELIGGGLFIAGIIGILKLLGALAKKKAAKAG
jgi:hypothetical protein